MRFKSSIQLHIECSLSENFEMFPSLIHAHDPKTIKYPNLSLSISIHWTNTWTNTSLAWKLKNTIGWESIYWNCQFFSWIVTCFTCGIESSWEDRSLRCIFHKFLLISFWFHREKVFLIFLSVQYAHCYRSRRLICVSWGFLHWRASNPKSRKFT